MRQGSWRVWLDRCIKWHHFGPGISRKINIMFNHILPYTAGLSRSLHDLSFRSLFPDLWLACIKTLVSLHTCISKKLANILLINWFCNLPIFSNKLEINQMGDAGGVSSHVASICAIPLITIENWLLGKFIFDPSSDDGVGVPWQGPCFSRDNTSLKFWRPFFVFVGPQIMKMLICIINMHP